MGARVKMIKIIIYMYENRIMKPIKIVIMGEQKCEKE
jgi:hypothetical protein